MHIRRDDLVLEVGSGDNPNPRSDVLSDISVGKSEERGGKDVVIDRPFMVCDAHRLPFADKSFDYIICSHVLEHSEDPEKLFNELMRVGQRGYIETPSHINEQIRDIGVHRWFVKKESETLILQRKTNYDKVLGEFFNLLRIHNRDYIRFYQSNERLFHVKYEWEGKIKYRIVPSTYSFKEFKAEDVLDRTGFGRKLSYLLADIVAFLPMSLREKLRELQRCVKRTRYRTDILIRRRAFNKRVGSIFNLLVCPICKQKVKLEQNRKWLICSQCEKRYAVRDGIPIMLVSE